MAMVTNRPHPPQFDPRNHSVIVYDQSGKVVMRIYVVDGRVRAAVTAIPPPPTAPPGTPPTTPEGVEQAVYSSLSSTLSAIGDASRKQSG